MTGSDADQPRRLLVVSASMGAGHTNAAAELARRLTERGHVVRTVDLLSLGRAGQGERLRRFYDGMLRRAPWAYDAAMQVWARWPEPLELITRAGAGAYEDGLVAQVRRLRADAVVSVFNLASQCLGRLKASGRIDGPIATYVTDPGAHPYWVHPAVDLHMAVTPGTAAGLRRYAARGVVTTGPLVAPPFSVRRSQERERRRFGLPDASTVALVAAGSGAVGQVEDTVRSLAALPGVLPVVLCGTDEGLRRRLLADRLGVPLGWVDDVPALMAAADVLVDNAGGLTCLEALTSGLPVVVFRPLAGHGRFNAASLAASGLARWARTEDDLAAELTRLRTDPAGVARRVERGRALAGAPVGVAEAVLGLLRERVGVAS